MESNHGRLPILHKSLGWVLLSTKHKMMQCCQVWHFYCCYIQDYKGLYQPLCMDTRRYMCSVTKRSDWIYGGCCFQIMWQQHGFINYIVRSVFNMLVANGSAIDQQNLRLVSEEDFSRTSLIELVQHQHHWIGNWVLSYFIINCWQRFNNFCIVQIQYHLGGYHIQAHCMYV